MEDFGYKKTTTNIKLSSMVKRSLLFGAAIFSLGLFLYITITAYHYVYSIDEKNIKIIKASEGPIKVFAKHKVINDNFDQAIYRDILENKKIDEIKESKIVKSPEPSKPNPEEAVKVTKIDKKVEVKPQEKMEIPEKKEESKIIVFNNEKSDEVKKVLNDKNSTRRSNTSRTNKNLDGNKRIIRVQVAALTSIKSAESSWDKLKRLYPDLFYDRNSIIQKVDLGQRGIFYRLQIGNFYDQIQAEEFCKKYITKANKSNADCIMVE